MNKGDIIFLSASVPYRKPWTEGAHPTEIEEAIVSLARAVFARGGRLLFGGHPSVSPLIAAIAGEYCPVKPKRKFRPVVTFQSEFFRANLPNETWEMHRMGFSAIEWTENLGNRKRSLERMREWMLLGPELPREIRRRNRIRPPKAMVAIGGMEGVRDEAAIFLRNRNYWNLSSLPPVMAVTSGGGAAARLLDPMNNWESRLWSEEDINKDDWILLQDARKNGNLFSLEDSWYQKHKDVLASFEQAQRKNNLQPYAAMMQWVADNL